MEIHYEHTSKIITRFGYKGRQYSLSQYRDSFKLLGTKKPMVFKEAHEVLKYVCCVVK